MKDELEELAKKIAQQHLRVELALLAAFSAVVLFVVAWR